LRIGNSCGAVTQTRVRLPLCKLQSAQSTLSSKNTSLLGILLSYYITISMDCESDGRLTGDDVYGSLALAKGLFLFLFQFLQ